MNGVIKMDTWRESHSLSQGLGAAFREAELTQCFVRRRSSSANDEISRDMGFAQGVQGLIEHT